MRVRLQRCAVLQATDLSQQEVWWRLLRIALDLVPSALRELFRVRWREQYGVTWEDGPKMGGIFVAGGLVGPCTVPVPGDLSFKSGNKMELSEDGEDGYEVWLGRVQDDGTLIHGVRAGDRLRLCSSNAAAADHDATVKCVVSPILRCPGQVKFKDKLPNKPVDTAKAACIMRGGSLVAEFLVMAGKKKKKFVTSEDDCITQAEAGDTIQLHLEGSDDLFTSEFDSVSAPDHSQGMMKAWLELNEYIDGAAGDKLSAFRCDEKGRVPAAKMRDNAGIDATAKTKYGVGQLSEWDTSTCVKALSGMDPPLVNNNSDLGNVINCARIWRNKQIAHPGSTEVTTEQFGQACEIALALFSGIDAVAPGNCTMEDIRRQLCDLSAPAARPAADEAAAAMQERFVQQKAMQERFEQQNKEIARDLQAEREQLDADIRYEEEQAELKAALAVSSRRYEDETSQRRLGDLRRRKALNEAAQFAQRIGNA
jgi:hypothetical protein